jgi:hypothetical protein
MAWRQSVSTHPTITADCVGTLAWEIAEIAAWISIVYDNNPLGMQDAWAAVAVATESLSVGSVALPNMDTYKIPLPRSLVELAPTGSMTFCAVSSRPVTLKGLPKDTLCDLVRTLIQTVHRDFQSCSHPEGLLVRAFSTMASDTNASKVILLGASNLGNCADRLIQQGLDVLDLTTPGWIASPDNVALLEEKLSNVMIGKKDSIILDLYGNLLLTCYLECSIQSAI